MAGAPGAGKSTVIDQLGLGDMPIVNPDEFYEPALEKCGLGKNIKKIKEDFSYARTKLVDVLKDILKLEEPEDGWSHDNLEQFVSDAMDIVTVQRAATYDLNDLNEKYQEERKKMQIVGTCFAQAQKDSKSKQARLLADGESFIIDGTGGFYSKIINQKKSLEDIGYQTAMIVINIPLQVAIDRQADRLAQGGRSLDAKTITRSWENLHGSEENPEKRPGLMNPFIDRYGKEQQGYETEFSPNFFQVTATKEGMSESVAEVKPEVDAFLNQVSESFQSELKPRLQKQMKRLLRHGGNKDSGPFDDEAPIDYRGSAPPGAPGG